MAHNGGVEEFSKIKRHLRAPLSDELYNWIKGQTDSEHIFASLITHLNSNHESITPDTVADSFEHTFRNIKHLMTKYDIREAAYLNMVTRYVSDDKEVPLTLYHSEGSRYVVEDGITRLEAPKDDDQAVMVVSEKLSDDKGWTMIPPNHFVIVEPSLNVRIKPIKD